MKYGLLGPLTIESGGQQVQIPGPRLRAALAMLLLQNGSPVAVEQFIDGLWGERSPQTARAQIHNVISKLRKALPAEAGEQLQLINGAYQFTVSPDAIDATRFTAGVRAARAAVRTGPTGTSIVELRTALALWRGEPLSGIEAPFVSAARTRLQEEHKAAHEALADLELACGNHAAVIAELSALLEEHPFWEGVAERLATALYRAGRQHDALAVLHSTRTRLVEELGLDPGPGLASAEQAILSATLDVPAPAPAVAPETGTAPKRPINQLPTDTRLFIGREEELGQLFRLVDLTTVGHAPGTVVLCAIDGLGGIGKSAVAVHAAHRVRERFPDGQLFLDLRAHAAGTAALSAEEALDALLRALGVAPQQIPRELGAKAALYRDTLCGTRTLILLDNAVSTAQVRPLLPAAPGCLVLVTSRKRLAGLDDAHTVALGVLSLAEATSLIRMVAGPNRLAEDDPGLPELAMLCGFLPLALRIAGSRLRHRRTLTVSDLAAQLRDERSRLTRLRDEERDVAAVFETSYRGMRHDEQQLLLLLGRIPGSDIDPYGAAALLGTSHDLAESLLESLLDNNLVMQRTPGRYLLHDLVRLYARTLGTADPSDPEGSVEAEGCDAALERLLDHYQYAAHLADSHIAPRASRDRIVDCPVPGVVPRLPDLAAALQWMRAERENLIAAALSTGPARTAALSGSLGAFLVQEGLPSRGAVLHRAAAAAAHELGDRRGEAAALDRLGRSRILVGDHQGAAELQRQALALHQGLGDRSGEATALWQLGRVHHMQRDYPAATRCHGQAMAIFRSLGDRLGEANTLWALGRVRKVALDYEGATGFDQRALAIYRELGESLGEANVLWDLGAIHRAQDDLPAAADLLEQALQAYRDLGHRLGEANARCELGYLRSGTGDYPAAVALFNAAMEIYSEIGERSGPCIARKGLARVRLEAGEPLAAEELLQQLVVDHRESGVRDEEASALRDLARVRLALGDRAGAAELLARARTLVEETGDRRGEAEVLHTTGSLLLETARPDEALTCFRRALDLARENRSPLGEARNLEGAARCAVRLGDHAAALPDLRQAVALYQRSGAAEGSAAESLLSSLKSAAALGVRG